MSALRRRGASLRRSLRGLFIRGCARLARLLAPSRPAPSPNAVKSVLVIRVDERVGNVLLTTPLLRELARALPGVRIEALVARSKVSLVEGIVRVVPFERRDLFRRPLAFVRVLRALRAARYDVAIDASHWHHLSLSSALLLAWTGAPIRIVHDRGEAARFGTHAVLVPSDSNEVDAKLALLTPLGIIARERRLETAVGRGADAERMRAWLGAVGAADRPLVGLAPGSRKPDHRLPPGLFAALGREARTLGATPIVLWGPGEEALAARVAQEGTAELAPPTTLGELAALMRACRVVVTNDTGPMHLSVACEAATIALFAQGDHGRWGHPAPPNAVIPAAGRPLEVVLDEALGALRKRLGNEAPPI